MTNGFSMLESFGDLIVRLARIATFERRLLVTAVTIARTMFI
jgi:hypothetical protein